MAFRITDRCTGCARCVTHCPAGAIAGAPCGEHRVEPALCVECGACGVVCPEQAVLDQHGNVFALELDAPARRRAAWVDPAMCTGCGDCVSGCPFDALELVAALAVPGGPVLARVMAERCVACSLCELECGRGAVVVARPRGCGGPTAL